MKAADIRVGIFIRNKTLKHARKWKVIKNYSGMFLIQRYDKKVAIIQPGQFRLFERIK